jgi:hypothetical protein
MEFADQAYCQSKRIGAQHIDQNHLICQRQYTQDSAKNAN